jgi:hypothetical protein
MARTIKLFLATLILLGASSQIAFSEDGLKIETETLEVNNIRVESGKSFMIFNSMGASAELVGPESDSLLKKYVGARDGYIPTSGFTAVGDKLYGHSQDKIRIPNKKSIFIKVEFEVNNISDSAQTFRLGDIALMTRGFPINFIAVGPNKLAYLTKSPADLKAMANVVYNLEPNDTRRFTYIFITQRDGRPWMLSYQEEVSDALNVEK